MVEKTYEKLVSIMNFLNNFPNREQIIFFLTENVCPNGEYVAVNTGLMNDDGEIHIQFRYGYNFDYPIEKTISIHDDNPTSESLRAMKVVFVDQKNIHLNYQQALNIGTNLDYNSGVVIPIGMRQLYGFLCHCDFEKTLSYRGYFECLQSILAFWETLNNSELKNKKPQTSEKNRELTARQGRILEMIIDNRTNASIATMLGYSESLIRQETIIIYRKLEISGRRDIKRNLAS